MRYHIKERLDFITEKLKKSKKINRSDLIDKFGISMVTASHDLRNYQKINGKLEYDSAGKFYKRKRK